MSPNPGVRSEGELVAEDGLDVVDVVAVVDGVGRLSAYLFVIDERVVASPPNRGSATCGRSS